MSLCLSPTISKMQILRELVNDEAIREQKFVKIQDKVLIHLFGILNPGIGPGVKPGPHLQREVLHFLKLLMEKERIKQELLEKEQEEKLSENKLEDVVAKKQGEKDGSPRKEKQEGGKAESLLKELLDLDLAKWTLTQHYMNNLIQGETEQQQ